MHDQEFEKFISIHNIISALNFTQSNFYSWMSQIFDQYLKGSLYLHYSKAEYHPEISHYPKGPVQLDGEVSDDERAKLNELRFLVPIRDSIFRDAMRNSEYHLFLKEIETSAKKAPRNDFLGDPLSPLFPVTIRDLWVDRETARKIVRELRVHLNIVELTLTIRGEEKSITPTQTLYLWALYELGDKAKSFIKTSIMYKKCGELQKKYSLQIVAPSHFEPNGKPSHPSLIYKENHSQENKADNWIEVSDDKKSTSELIKCVLKITNITLPPLSSNSSNFRPD
jgi:hypothetical protein